MLLFKALWYDWIDFTRTQIGYFIILSDAIIHGLTACTALILQIVIFKITTQRSTRFWILILTGLGIIAFSFLGIPFPKSGFIALVFLVTARFHKNLRHTILEAFFILYIFSLMVRLVIFLINPIFPLQTWITILLVPLTSFSLFYFGLLKTYCFKWFILVWSKSIKRDLGTNQPLSPFVA